MPPFLFREAPVLAIMEIEVLPLKSCHACGEVWENAPGAQPGRSETCLKCGADLHCCLNCALFDPSAPNQCSSRTTDPVKSKERGNYCDEFEFGAKKRGGEEPPGTMDRRWNDLFK